MIIGVLQKNDISLVLQETVKNIFGIFCCWNKNYMPKITPFWFIWVLVMIKIAYAFINQLGWRRKLLIGFLCVVYCLCANITKESFPFLLDRTIIAMPFYICGNIFRVEKKVEKIFGLPFSYKLALSILCMVIMLLTLNYSGSYDMFSMYKYINGRSVLWYYLISFMGTFVLLLCCERLPSNKYIVLLSEGTLLILAIHLTVMKILDKFGLFEIEPFEFLICILLCLLCLPFIKFSKKYFPYALGRKSKKNN